MKTLMMMEWEQGKEEWRCASTKPGVQFVMNSFKEKMLKWFVNSWMVLIEEVIEGNLCVQCGTFLYCPLIIGALVVGQPRPGSGPVFLERLSCEGNESSILECKKCVGLCSVQHAYSHMYMYIRFAQWNFQKGTP